MWLAPEQLRLVPVADRHREHTEGLASRLRARGLRPAVDPSRDTVPKKVREAQLMKVPYTVVVGDGEVRDGTVAGRERSGKEVRGVPFDAFVEAIIKEMSERSLESIDLAELTAASRPTPTV